MARLAISQKTITDITDGYTVNLVPNSGTFSTNNPGTTDDDVVMNITFVATGSQTGPSGTDGTSNYTWIRYANKTNPTWSETSDNPSGMTYIGFAKTTENVQPTTVNNYNWSKFVGEDGDNGQDGKPGYTFIVKSSNGDVFRNNSGSTVITLYIYKADMQHITGSAFETEVGGTLKCFKDTVPNSGNTGEITVDKTGDDYSITVNANTVDNVASYFWVLEEN